MTRATTPIYKRGAIVLADLEPVIGSEQGGMRPCVILSHPDRIRASRARALYVIAPLTRSVTLVGALAPRIKARVGGVPLDSTVLVMHIRSLDASRVRSVAGKLNNVELETIMEGVRQMLEA